MRRLLLNCVSGLGLWLAPGLMAVDPVINEIHTSPPLPTERTEFVEIHWPGEQVLDLSGWSLSGGIQFTFPAGSRVDAGGFVVVSQDPGALSARFGVAGLGPWTGRLASTGERLTLRDASGAVRDTVGYGLGFPWPTVGEPPGYSLELIHPSLDNDLGGHWRSSVAGPFQSTVVPLVGALSTWSLFRGTQAPPSSWATPEFDDAGWSASRAPVGYDPDVAFGTPLPDMRGQYTQFFLRKRIEIPQPERFQSLRIEALYDDGFKLWLNGVLLTNPAMSSGDVPWDGVANGGARENNGYEPFDIPLPRGLLRTGPNVIAVQVANVSLGGSSDCFFDARLLGIEEPANRGPSPGRPNVVLSTNAPPAIRQVSHVPEQPKPGETVVVSARVSDPDGVDAVVLEYQIVEPGRYVHALDAGYAEGWVQVPMTPAVEDPLVFTAGLPAQVNQHRHLVRYRIRATDRNGAGVRVPYADDPCPNFAWFCYGAVPSWTGAVRPGAVAPFGTPFTVDTSEMNRLPVYHLIARRADVEASTWRDRSHGDEYFWTGTLVYDGRVYDHIRFRPRGGVWRYAMGKNMWKFDFNRGHDFEARDAWGRRIGTPWTKLNLGACIQQGDHLHRGEQGMFESVGFRLFQLTGVPASHTAFVQFRVVDDPLETDPADQFGGDFWGLYLAVEQLDARFLEEHGLADGNLYKMEGGTGEPNNIGPLGPADSSDLAAFLSEYSNGTGLTETWWRSRLDLDRYYSYQAIIQAIHHYDIADGKNYFYHHDPGTGRWTVLPWDLDLTWADNMYRAGVQGGNEPFKSRVLSNFGPNPAFPTISREFRNRVREIRDLLWNEDEAYRLIDEMALRVRGTNRFSIIDADRARWDYNPIMADGSLVYTVKAGQGMYYNFPLYPDVSKTFSGVAQLMKRYVTYRGSDRGFSLDTLSAEPSIPNRPVLSYTGPEGYPVHAIRLRREAYSGSAPLRSVKWRVAEISRTNHPAWQPDRPMPYEIESVWESGELGPESETVTVPIGVLRVGRLYRARVRVTDSEGRTSSWSAPIEFTAGAIPQADALREFLRVTEVMYNPPPEGFEFLELHNANPTEELSLEGLRFGDGIDYTFPLGSRLAPGAYGILIRTTNTPAFRAHHQLEALVPVFGPYAGALDNAGERVVLQAGRGGETVLEFTYGTLSPWPQQADGGGYSLVSTRTLPGSAAELSAPESWRRSTLPGGSPGRADPPSPGVSWTSYRIENNEWVLAIDCAPTTAWRLESAGSLSDWSLVARFVGPASTRVALKPADIQFLRIRVE